MPTTIKDLSVKLKFQSFSRFQFGNAWVAFKHSKAEAEAGRYDPHVLFIHDHSESRDEEIMIQVEKDCLELARLMSKFRIAREFLTDKAVACDVTDSSQS